MGKSFTFYLKGAHRPITISDINESRTLPELKNSIAELLVKRDTLIFCTDSDCVILKPDDISGITITNYTSKDRVSIESTIMVDEIFEDDTPVVPTTHPKPKIVFEDLGLTFDEEDEPLVVEHDHDELDITPSVNKVEQARNSFMNELDNFVAEREVKMPKKETKPKKTAKDKLLEDVKLAKNHQHVTTVPSDISIDDDVEDEDEV